VSDGANDKLLTSVLPASCAMPQTVWQVRQRFAGKWAICHPAAVMHDLE
jgi:hypothetical protein